MGKISIHVPAWGTTVLNADDSTFIDISIHVPAWGTTLGVGETIAKPKFQSTFPRGERR